MDTSFVYIYDADSGVWNKIENGIDYSDLTNTPSINGVNLIGNKSLSDIGAAEQSDVSLLSSALIDIIDSGAKNVANWTGATETMTDVTFTNNGDYTITTSGTATGARRQKALTFTVRDGLPTGNYILSGCPLGGAEGSTIKYCLYLWDITDDVRISMNDVGAGVEFSWTPDPTHRYFIGVDIRKGTNANNLTFKPMICSKAAFTLSKKFVAYIPSNLELWNMILSMS